MQKKTFVAICFGFSEKIASLTGLFVDRKLVEAHSNFIAGHFF